MVVTDPAGVGADTDGVPGPERAPGPGADRATDPATDGVPEWSDLPDNVRTDVIAIAARALGEVPADQVPTALAPVARFTPGKRARLGAGPLARALEHDTGFRALVAQHLPDGRGDDGSVTADASDTADPVRAAARAFLLRLPRSEEAVAAAARADEVAVLRSQVSELTAAVDKLTARLAALAADRQPLKRAGGHARRGTTGTDPADPAEVERLRRRLREQGSRVKVAEEQARAAVQQALIARDEAATRAERERASAENWRARAEQEAHRADLARQALDRQRAELGQQRADTDRRIDLLLGTLQRAASGLRHEWHLAADGSDPADVVARSLPEVDQQNRRSVDRSLLLDWLGLPHAHLIVDGYNVTKTGYPELSLADQRDRLTRSLAALAARTGAEVTVVFDGAAVVAAAPSARGVRVIFSPPGVIADEVIRRLAAAEPSGRVVVVVSSDREVVDGVRRSGAHTAPSPVLLAVLA